MKAMKAGVTKAGKGIDNLSWNILGQTYVPKALTESRLLLARAAAARHLRAAAHPHQPGRVHLRAGGQVRPGARRQGAIATAGDFIRLPMKIMHGLFNKSDQPIKCLFWVSPTGKLFDLFKKINNVPDPAEVTRLAALHDVNFLPPPPGKG